MKPTVKATLLSVLILGTAGMSTQSKIVQLPEPRLEGSASLEQTLAKRRTVREFSDEPISLENVSQLLWAAQGITNKLGYRTAPSAGALFPLELYLAAGNVAGLDTGLYSYEPRTHVLTRTISHDVRPQLANAALGQPWVRDCAAVIVFTAVPKRTTKKYGERGIRYIHIEVGHASQNVFLQAVALGLGAGVVGAFEDNQLKEIIKAEDGEEVLYLMPVGYTK
jgi:SagB-type dehydrogenase family enzyme